MTIGSSFAALVVSTLSLGVHLDWVVTPPRGETSCSDEGALPAACNASCACEATAVADADSAAAKPQVCHSEDGWGGASGAAVVAATWLGLEGARRAIGRDEPPAIRARRYFRP